MQEKSLYIKVISPTVYEKIVQKHEGETKFKYGNGEQKQIKISKADSPAITVRVFNLPPEVPNSMVTTALTSYGKISTRTIDIKRRANDDTARGARRTGEGRYRYIFRDSKGHKRSDRQDGAAYVGDNRPDRGYNSRGGQHRRTKCGSELMETTVIPPESKSPSQFGEASLEVSRTLQVEEPTETPSKKLKPTTQQENSRDPRLRSRDAGPSNAATDKNSPHVNPSSKTKNSPTRPHPYAIYGRTKESSKKESAEGNRLRREYKQYHHCQGTTNLDMLDV
ncbi:hypothetical protein ANN_09544 [Periplaneta americana]|uniref:Uncharacterized protein n=1 Tax=Periplaneta americana TaxID=6978 RepID=A0ABQ8TLZ5_PERAM|nr:hypothetical protein ANN_09544 [Periplaneta americana]